MLLEFGAYLNLELQSSNLTILTNQKKVGSVFFHPILKEIGSKTSIQIVKFCNLEKILHSDFFSSIKLQMRLHYEFHPIVKWKGSQG